MTDTHYKYDGIHGTRWNSQQGPDSYRLQLETDDKSLYEYMEKAAQKCIDIAHKFPIKHFKKKKLEENSDAKN